MKAKKIQEQVNKLTAQLWVVGSKIKTFLIKYW